jgi:hypothetical protein
MNRMRPCRCFATLVVSLAAATAWAGKGRPANFKGVPLGTFEPAPCSPSPVPKTKQAILFNMPKEIDWGAPLPICGVARPGMDRDGRPLPIRIRINVEQSTDREPGLSGILVERDRAKPSENGLTFFNVDGLAFTALPPGDYRVRIDADYDAVAGSSRPLRIVSAGWRKELSGTLVHHLCAQNLLEDLSPYFHFLGELAIERPESGEAAAADMESLREKWQQAFAPHRAILTPKIRAGLQTLTQPDSGIAWHVLQAMRVQCPGKSPADWRPIEDLLGAIHNYEIQR